MVEDIQKAIGAYRGLNPVEKRLFREETGLNSVKRRAGGRRRTATKAKSATTPRQSKSGGTLGQLAPAAE